jgi:hypothetical protein
MARRKQSYLKGRFEPRRTEGDYMAVLLDAVTLEEWRSVVVATVAAAKAGDPSARAWLAQYLVGKPGATAPAPLTVVVQQLSGRDPLVDKLAKPHSLARRSSSICKAIQACLSNSTHGEVMLSGDRTRMNASASESASSILSGILSPGITSHLSSHTSIPSHVRKSAASRCTNALSFGPLND